MCSLNFHIIPHCMKCEYNMLTNNGVFCNRTCISIAVCTQKYICSASLQSSGFFIFFFWFGEIIVQFGLFVCIQFHQKVSYQHKHHAHYTVHTHAHMVDPLTIWQKLKPHKLFVQWISLSIGDVWFLFSVPQFPIYFSFLARAAVAVRFLLLMSTKVRRTLIPSQLMANQTTSTAKLCVFGEEVIKVRNWRATCIFGRDSETSVEVSSYEVFILLPWQIFKMTVNTCDFYRINEIAAIFGFLAKCFFSSRLSYPSFSFGCLIFVQLSLYCR